MYRSERSKGEQLIPPHRSMLSTRYHVPCVQFIRAHAFRNEITCINRVIRSVSDLEI